MVLVSTTAARVSTTCMSAVFSALVTPVSAKKYLWCSAVGLHDVAALELELRIGSVLLLETRRHVKARLSFCCCALQEGTVAVSLSQQLVGVTVVGGFLCLVTVNQGRCMGGVGGHPLLLLQVGGLWLQYFLISQGPLAIVCCDNRLNIVVHMSVTH